MCDAISVRTFVTFEAEFPDDAVWDRRENCIVPGGKGIACTIREALMAHVTDCSVVRSHSFYGWAFDVSIGKCRFVCVIQGSEPWLLICEKEDTSLLEKLWRRTHDERLAAAVNAVHVVLTNDPRFTAVQWFTREEYERGATRGAATP